MTRGKPGGSQETRIELLEAGLRVLLRDGLPSGFNVKLSDVVQEASRTTGAAYQIWATQDEFRLDLATHVALHISYADSDSAQAALELMLVPNADLWSVVETTGRAYFEHLVGRSDFYLSLHFWSTADNLPPEVNAAVVESYAALQSSFELFFKTVLDHFGVEFRPPHSIADLTMGATAITEGAALRHRFSKTEQDRQAVVDLYVTMLASHLASMTTATR